MNKKQLAAVVVLLLGLFVSFGASVIPRMMPQEMFWTEEQAAQQGSSAARLHRETFEAAKVQTDNDATEEEKAYASQQLAAAQERFDESRKALDEAQFWRSTVPRILRWTGAGIALIGVFGVLAFKTK